MTTRVHDAAGQRRFRRILQRIWFWLRRYGIAEVAGLLALAAIAIPLQAGGAAIGVVTVGAVIGENIGFYAAMLVQTFFELRRTHCDAPLAAVARRTMALIVAEFGPAELLDSLLVRPIAVALSLVVLGNSGGSLLVGKVVADIVFYAAASAAYWATETLGWRRVHTHE